MEYSDARLKHATASAAFKAAHQKYAEQKMNVTALQQKKASISGRMIEMEMLQEFEMPKLEL